MMVYRVAHITAGSREAIEQNKTFVGLEDTGDENVVKSSVEGSFLPRSLTPLEIKKLIEDNSEILQKFSPLFKGKENATNFAVLDGMQAKADESDIERPLTLEELDDEFQTKEIVFGVTLDKINKRITVVFRGTEGKLAFKNNWSANFKMGKKRVLAPDSIKDLCKGGTLGVHSGYYGKHYEEIVIW